MRGFPSDLEIASADHPQLRRDENTPEEQRDARDTIRRHATDIDDCELLLQALGLMPYPSRTGTRKWDRNGLGLPYTEPAQRRPRPAVECGSAKGAQAHRRAGEELCRVCESWAADRLRRTRVPHGSRCGTPAGAQMHRQLGELICEPCRIAESTKSAERYAAAHPGRPSERDPGRRRKYPPAANRAPTRAERTLLLLVDGGSVLCRGGRYLRGDGEDVTRTVIAAARAGWLNERAASESPVLTEAGRAAVAKSFAAAAGWPEEGEAS